MNKKQLQRYITVFLITGCICFVVADNQNYTPSGGTWYKTTDGKTYTHKNAVFSQFRFSSENTATNTYTYEVSPPGDYLWSFIPSKTWYNGGEKVGNPTAQSSKIKKVIDANTVPTTFTLSMGGQLTKNGTGTGTVTWNASANTAFYWVDTAQGKTLTIPVGAKATATAHHSSDAEYAKSQWTIGNNAVQIKTPVNSLSLTTIYSYLPMFKDDKFQGIPAGKYQVEGKSAKDTSQTDRVTWEVVQGDFYEKTSLDFDDYTDFEPKNAYYSNNSSSGKNSRGRAQTVYVVKKPGIAACVTLNLIPSPITKDVSAGNGTTKQSGGTLTFSAAGIFNAKLNSTTLCSAIVYEYASISRNILFVKVQKGKSGSIPDLPARTIISTVYNKLNITFSQYEFTMSYPDYPKEDTWSATGLSTLKNYLINNTNVNTNNYRHIIFVVFGQEPGVAGRGEMPGKYSIIYQNPNSSTIPHEMGHNYNLSHTGENGSGDIDNLMTTPSNNRIKLRKNQWSEVRK